MGCKDGSERVKLHEPCCGDSFRSKQPEVKTVIRLDAAAGCRPGDLAVTPVPSALRDSSILISFFFTFRVELTSLWSLLKAADSSGSPSDRSQG